MQHHHEKTDMGRVGLAAVLAALILAGAPLSARAGGPAPTAVAAPPKADATDRLIVKYRSGVAGARAAATGAERTVLHRTATDVAARSGLRLQLVRVGAFDTQVMRLGQRLALSAVQQLARDIAAADPAVEYAEPDRMLYPQFTPNDTQYGQQWHYFEATGGLNLPAAWEKSTGTGVVTAVIDTGYRPHADLAANILPGYDFIADTFIANDGNGRDKNARDPGDAVLAGECGIDTPVQDQASTWHGTHVAGTIAAVSNNGNGVAGVAFHAKVVPVRVLGKCGGYTSDIADAIVWASGGTVGSVPANPHPARVLNLSLTGGGPCDTTSQNAIDSARSRNAVVVVAAGNYDADVADFSPASCSGVIAVAATDRSGGRAYYSNYGAGVSVAAPGGDMRSSAANGILSTLNNGAKAPGADSFAYYQGTSMATPQVVGVVALMLAKNPALTPDEVATRLKASARAFPAPCPQCGTGIVDASAAVDAAGGAPNPPTGGNEVEPNDTPAKAQAVSKGVTITGTLASSSDSDYFKVKVADRSSLVARLTPNAGSDYDLYIYNERGWQVGSSLNGTGRIDSETITNRGMSPAIYYVRVRFYSGGTGAAGGGYTLRVN